MKVGSLASSALVAAILTIGAATPAWAEEQSSADQPAADGSDIIVTARRYEERLQDTPISITVFNQDQLDKRNIVNAQDLATYTPSLSTNATYGNQNSTFAIRGFVQDAGTQPSVGVYFADVVAPRGAANQVPVGDGAGSGSFFDLQNVQVLKGPQGTLFGRNTTGGAILLVPQKPKDVFEGYVEGSLGNHDMKRIKAVINLPVNESMRFRLGVDHQTREGYLRNDSGIGPTHFNDIDYTVMRASLLAELAPELENYTIATYTRSDTNGDIQKMIACNPASFFGGLACASIAAEQAKRASYYTVQNSMPDARALLTQWQVINTTTWRASDALTAKNIVSYAELRQTSFTTIFGGILDLSPVFGLPNGAVTLNPFPNRPYPGRHTAAQSTFTEEFRLEGKALADRLNWQAGAYLEVSEPLGLSGYITPVFLICPSTDAFQCSDPLGFGNVAQNSTKTSFRDVGLYAQGTYRLTDHLSLTGGFRYTWDRVRNFSQVRAYSIELAQWSCPDSTNPVLHAPDCTQTISQRSSAPTWLIDLDYKPTSDLLIYAKYARGYRSGGVAANTPIKFAIFKPEKVDAYEVGLKLGFGGALRGTLNLAGFYNDFRNQQLMTSLIPNRPGLPFASGNLNAGKSRIYGFEAEASLTPFEGLTLNASYAYLNTRILKIVIPATTSADPYSVASVYKPGDQLKLTPKNQLSITGTYRLPFDDRIGQMSVGATFVHIDRIRSTYDHALYGFPQLDYAPARNQLNLNYSWGSIAGSPVDLEVFATNVTNKKYYIPGDLIALGYETAIIAEPRMVGARIRYRFGS